MTKPTRKWYTFILFNRFCQPFDLELYNSPIRNYAAIFDLDGRVRLGSERNLYQGGVRRSKNKERGRGEEMKVTPT